MHSTYMKMYFWVVESWIYVDNENLVARARIQAVENTNLGRDLSACSCLSVHRENDFAQTTLNRPISTSRNAQN